MGPCVPLCMHVTDRSYYSGKLNTIYHNTLYKYQSTYIQSLPPLWHRHDYYYMYSLLYRLELIRPIRYNAMRYTNDSVHGGWVYMAVMGITDLVLVQQWRHCNDCMHCCLSFMQHWQRLAPQGPNIPRARSIHAADCLMSQLGIETTLFTLGGLPNKDGWLCNLHTVKWMKVGFVFEKVVTQALTHIILSLYRIH